MEKTTGGIHWRTLAGQRDVIFGQSVSARIADPAAPGRVFQWLLEESRDDRGNIVTYTYKQEDLDNVDVNAIAEHNRLVDTTEQAQRYLKRVVYGNTTPGSTGGEVFEVVFDYGEHGTVNQATGELDISPAEDRAWPARADTVSSYRSGFEVRTRRLCRRVLMFHHFTELGAPTLSYLVGSTDFTYDESSAITYLTGVTQRGYVHNDATGRFIPTGTPTLELDYIRPQVSTTVGEVDPRSLENLPAGIDAPAYRLLDLDGEGVPGIVTQQGGHWYYKRGNGDGTFGPMVALSSAPSSMGLGGAAQLLDLDGDGRKELVEFGPPTPGFYERTGEDWGAFKAFSSVPSIAYDDPNLQLLDLTGDGFPDILLARDDHFLWYPSLGKDGFGAAPAGPQAALRAVRAGPGVCGPDPVDLLRGHDRGRADGHRPSEQRRGRVLAQRRAGQVRAQGDDGRQPGVRPAGPVPPGSGAPGGHRRDGDDGPRVPGPGGDDAVVLAGGEWLVGIRWSSTSSRTRTT